MTDSTRWPDAALAGYGSSMRTFAAPAMLGLQGRLTGKPRIAVLLLAAGELATDKTSAATDRTDIPAMLGRVAAGAYAGNEIASVPGAAAGAIAAAVGTYATWRVRGIVVQTTGLPDPVVAIGEDVLAYGAAAIATRPDSDPGEITADEAADSPESDSGRPAPGNPRAHVAGLLRDAGVGVLAGLAGTAVMTIAQGAEFVLTDAEPSNSPSDVADKIKRRAGRGRLKKKHRRVANQGMHWLYGTSWGIPYGIVAARSKVSPEVSGPVFGLLVWGAALGHEPLLGIADVPWKRSVASLSSEALFHVVYGVGAGAALQWLRSR